MSSELRKPIKELDRDCEILSKLIRSELGIYDDITIDKILNEYKTNNPYGFDAESYLSFIKKITWNNKLIFPFPYPTDEQMIQAIEERTGYNYSNESERDKINYISQIMFLYPLNHLGENTNREFFIKNSKEYENCKTNKEKEEYIKVHF